MQLKWKQIIQFVGCAQPNLPGVYAEVSTVMPWVRGIIGDCASKEPATTPKPTTTTPKPTPTTTPRPTATTNPITCTAPNWQGDRWCDDDNNNAECNWDGGDCCPGTNHNPDRDYYCSSCMCLDPNAPPAPFDCQNVWRDRRCHRILNRGKCGWPRPQIFCKKTCGVCLNHIHTRLILTGIKKHPPFSLDGLSF